MIRRQDAMTHQHSKKVVYRPKGGKQPEIGEIVGFSGDPNVAFVRYRGNQNAKVTKLADLEWFEAG